MDATAVDQQAARPTRPARPAGPDRPRTHHPADGQGVPAAPFRAHVEHLCAAEAISWRVVARLAGVSALVVQRLLSGRNGRALNSIDQPFARRLFMITPGTIDGLRQSMVPGAAASRELRRLLRLGWDPAALSRRLQLSMALIDQLLVDEPADRGLTICSRLVEAKILAEADVLGPPEAAWAA